MDLQPFLHVLLAAVQAPTQAWSARDGQVRAAGAQGFYHGDVRVLEHGGRRLREVRPDVDHRHVELEPQGVHDGAGRPCRHVLAALAVVRRREQP